MDDPHGLTRGHDPDLGAGPGEAEVGAEVLRVHRDHGAAVCLPQDDGELRDPGAGERPQQRGAVADHPGALLSASGHETRGVDEHDQRQPEAIAALDEEGGLLGGGGVDHAAEAAGLVRDDTHRAPLDPGQRGDHVPGPALAELEQLAAVGERADHVADVIDPSRFRRHRRRRVRVSRRLRQGERPRLASTESRRQHPEQLSRRLDGLALAGCDELADAVS